MSPTNNSMPPRHVGNKEKKHPEYQREGSVRAAFDHETPTTTERMRARLNSGGSTRGAFFTGAKQAKDDSRHHHHHHHHGRRKKKSPKKSPPKSDLLSSNAEAMGNMASLAMAGLAQDDIGGFLDGDSPLKDNKSSLQRPSPPTGPHQVRIQEPSSIPPHPFSRPVDSPIDDIEAPKGLETIIDDSDADFAYTPDVSSHAVPPPTRSALAGTRTQLSEKSLDMNALMMQPPTGTTGGVPRRESLNMQYSGGSFDNGNDSATNNFLAQLRGDMPPSTRMSDRSALHGIDISMRTSDFEASNTFMNDQNVEVMLPNNTAYPGGGGGWYEYPQSAQPNSYSQSTTAAQQQQEIANFSSMAMQQPGYGSTLPPPTASAFQERQLSRTLGSELNDDDDDDDDMDKDDPYSFEEDEDEDTHNQTFTERVRHCLDPTSYLLSDAHGTDEDGHPKFDEHKWTIPALLRHLLYNPEYPEFTSLQQFSWAIILGVVMGVYTAVWKCIIEKCVDFVWQTIPRQLYEWGFFTDLDGRFPMPNYMWICPAIFGGILSYIFVILPRKIPGQNEWIQALHARGVQDHETFWPLFVLSTLGMSSGLSLGPELPLVLTAGMVGSWLGVVSRQSMLQARVMNLTAASAAVGGFFGFPMAGAMFVLEIPHRMGLQYFEALSPATISSIVAVLVNRMIVNNDVTGYYNYPFLTATLPSHIFTTAIVYGLVGCGIGVIYAQSVLYLKHVVHDLFNTHHHGHNDEKDGEHEDDSQDEMEKEKHALARKQNGNRDETIPLVVHTDSERHNFTIYDDSPGPNIFERIGDFTKKVLSFGIENEPARAAVAGTLAGLIVGITCMFVPHVTFWGEAQLQTLIDKGRTPLPVFGEEHKSTQDLTAYGFCLINPKDPSEVAAGFSIGCAALITSAKIFVTGLSLGTGIIGGHFWGPLFVGCAASHLLTDLANLFQRNLGFGEVLAAYPCVSILCMMGSTHVVTFRAHMAIMLILTLTISAFDSGDSSGTGYTAGDYSAVFPLLVVSVFVSLMISRSTVFYAAQRSRGDIMALPEVLCEPGKAGAPMVIDYDEGSSYYETDTFASDGQEQDVSYASSDDDTTSTDRKRRRMMNANVNADDIEKEFAQEQHRVSMSRSDSESSDRKMRKTSSSSQHRIPEPDVPFLPKAEVDGPPILPRPINVVPDGRSKTAAVDHDEHPSIAKSNMSAEDFDLPSKRLEEMLAEPLEPRFRPPKRGNRHRRIHSAPDGEISNINLDGSPVSATSPSRSPRHRRIGSFGGENLRTLRERSNSASSSRAGTPTAGLKKINSYGEVADFQPSLLDQARARASSMHRRTGSSSSLPKPRIPRGRHSRQNSNASVSSSSALAVFTDLPVTGSATGVSFPADVSTHVETGLSTDEMDQTFAQASSGLGPSIWS